MKRSVVSSPGERGEVSSQVMVAMSEICANKKIVQLEQVQI